MNSSIHRLGNFLWWMSRLRSFRADWHKRTWMDFWTQLHESKVTKSPKWQKLEGRSLLIESCKDQGQGNSLHLQVTTGSIFDCIFSTLSLESNSEECPFFVQLEWQFHRHSHCPIVKLSNCHIDFLERPLCTHCVPSTHCLTLHIVNIIVVIFGAFHFETLHLPMSPMKATI